MRSKKYNFIIILTIFFFLSIVFFLYLKIKNYSKDFNLILISVDALRSDRIGVYGYDKNTTPNIDQWAKQATVFTNVMTVVPGTYGSFTALMTGRHPFKTKIIYNKEGYIKPIGDLNQTLSEILRQHEYTNAAFVSNGWLNSSTNINKGFDQYNMTNYFPYETLKGNSKFDRGNYETFINKSINWLQENKSKKFFLWIHLIDPHAPYNPPNDFKCKFGTGYCDLINSKSDQQLEEERKSLMGCQEKPLPGKIVNLYETLYDGSVAYSDRLVGNILNKIKALGLDKKSIIIFYGDHGEGFDHNYYFFHGQVLYNSNVKIPLIIQYPLDKGGKRNNRLIDNTDLFPTILNLLNIHYSSKFIDGKSFANSFLGNFLPINLFGNEKKYTYSISDDGPKFSIYDGRYKYIYSYPKTCVVNNNREELYDLRKDKNEEVNIVSSNNEVREKLKKLLLQTLTQYNFPQYDSPAEKEQRTSPDILEKLKSMGY